MINRKNILPYLLVSPYVIHFILFVAFPVGFSIVLTFHKWNIISPMEFTGVNNYIRLFNDKTFLKSMGNTIIFLLIHIPLQIIFALFLAEILNQKIKLRGVFRGAFFLPVIVSGVVVSILWQQLYGYDTGLLNRLLVGIGLGKIGWLTDPNIAMASIAVMATWKNVGLYIVLFLVGLQTVPTQYYEAADLEGATHLQKFFKITLPMINPTIFMVIILSTPPSTALSITASRSSLNSSMSRWAWLSTNIYGNLPTLRSPVVSSSPNIMFMFWTALPAWPFMRLSI